MSAATLPESSTAADAAPAPTPAGPCRIWVEPSTEFDTRRICGIRHDFDRHPLMQIPRLGQLAEALWSRALCRFLVPGSTDSTSLKSALRVRSPDGRGPAEVFRRIEEPGAWIALYNVETDPEYRAFVDEVLQAAAPLLARRGDRVFKASGYIFISSPPSVTPYHIDREHNFWLMLKGRKTMSVWDRNDPRVLPGPVAEQFLLTGSLDGVKLDDDIRARGRHFDSGPGDGVYFPSTTPHMTTSDSAWTTPGDGVSISMGVNFYSTETLKEARVHLCNQGLRRLGVKAPSPPHARPWLDALKAPVGAAMARRHKDWPQVTGWSFGFLGD